MSLHTTGPSRIPIIAQKECSFLESILPVQAFAHLTTVRRTGEDRLHAHFIEWTFRIQAHHRITLGWVRSIEAQPMPHVHTALVAAIPLDCECAAAFWQERIAPRFNDAARVEPYRLGLCGIGYILKQIGSHGDGIRYSENIRAFTREPSKSLFPTTPAQRRQQRRISEQSRRAFDHREEAVYVDGIYLQKPIG